MVSGQAMVLSLMACALLSSGISHLISPSMYGALAALLPVPAATPDPASDPPADQPAGTGSTR